MSSRTFKMLSTNYLFTNHIFSLYTFHLLLSSSASIHRYVNNSDIQVLMMVTEAETLNVEFIS